MNKSICFFTAILLFVWPGRRLQAQERLTLKEAIDYALTHKADVKKAELDVENASYRIAESKSQAYPQINASGGLNYNAVLQKIPLPGNFLGEPGKTFMVPMQLKWNSMVGVQLQQMLFNSKVFIGMKAAKASKEFFEMKKQLTDEQLIEKVATAYYRVFTQKQKLKTIDSSYANTLKTRNIIEGLFKNGLAKEIDLDRIKVNLTNLKTAQTQLQNGVSQLENTLKFYMGMPIETDLNLQLAPPKVDPLLLPNKIDISKRTEVKVLEKQKELLKYNVQVTKADLYPSLYLVGNYAWQGYSDQFPIGHGTKNGAYWSDFSTVGIKVNIPIFSGLGTKAKVHEAKIRVEKVAADLEDTKLGMNLAYQNAKTQLENSLKSVEGQKANQRLAQKVYSNTQNNYKYGLATLTDLLEAENALVKAKNNYTNALLDYKMAEIQLYKAKGALKEFVNQLAD